MYDGTMTPVLYPLNSVSFGMVHLRNWMAVAVKDGLRIKLI